MSAPLIVSAEKIIEIARERYQMIPDDDVYAQNVVRRMVASLLELEDEDYEDLVRHLVTADDVDPDALRWATNASNSAPLSRSTVPEGSQGGGWHVNATAGWSGHTTG